MLLLGQRITILLGFFIASVLSCSPSNFDGNYATIVVAGTGINGWRLNIAGGLIIPSAQIITYNSGINRPSENEIFMAPQPTPGVFEFLSYLSFSRSYAIGVPSANSGDTFRFQQRINSNSQQFTFDCGTCDIKTNALDWTQYHTSCKIKDVGTGFCMIGIAGSPTNNAIPVNQTDCAAANTWDVFGIISPDAINFTALQSPNATQSSSPSSTSSSSYTSIPTSSGGSNGSNGSNSSDSTSGSNSTSTVGNASQVHLSPGGLVGIVLGSCAGTTLIAFLVGYWIFRRNQKFPVEVADRVDVEIHDVVP